MAPIILKDCLSYWRTLIIILTPILLTPFLFAWQDNPAANCAYVILLIAVYWVTDVLPLPVTALLPIVLFPLLGVLSGKKVTSLYMADATMVMLAGLMMALAIEKSNLHKRFGMWMLLLFGFTPSRMLVGFIVPTWFLSMWISNTATASMMVPIASAVVEQYRRGLSKAKKERQMDGRMDEVYGPLAKTKDSYLDDFKTPKTINSLDIKLIIPLPEKTDQSVGGSDQSSDFKVKLDLSDESSSSQSGLSIEKTSQSEMSIGNEEISLNDEMETKIANISKMLSLSVAYAAGFGGNGTLTGASSNLIVVEEVSKSFEAHGMISPLNYSTWFFVGFPFSLVGIVVLALWMKLYFLGWRSFKISCKDGDDDDDLERQQKTISNIVREEYHKLGPISFSELSSLFFMVTMVLLWFARDPGFVPGYSSLFEKGFVTDAVPAILISVLLFAFPSEAPDWLCLRESKNTPAKRVGALLDWHTVVTKLPWGTIVLLGGGFAMAEGCKTSGLSRILGDILSELRFLPIWVIIVVTIVLVTMTTEIMCGCATMALFLPILDAMATDFEVNPLLLMLPAGLAASCAFMLPTGSIQNSIVFSYGNLKVIDMIKVGVVLNTLCVPLVCLAMGTWGNAILKLGELPWKAANATLAGGF